MPGLYKATTVTDTWKSVRRTEVAHVRSALEIHKEVQCRGYGGLGTREGKPVLPLQLLAIYRGFIDRLTKLVAVPECMRRR